MDKLIQRETNKYAKSFYEEVEKTGHQVMNGDRYTDSRIPVTLKCNKGHITKIKPNAFKRGWHCVVCSNKKSKDKRIYNFTKRVKKAGYSYRNKSRYVDDVTTVDLFCDKGHEFSVIPTNFVQGVRCSACSRFESLKKRAIEFEDYAKQEGYVVVGKGYKDARKHVKMKCPKGHDYSSTPTNFKSGRRCARCTSSKGEQRISEFLEHNELKYIPQKRFKNCRDIYPLPFDFYVDNKNGLLIEYDGQQHYDAVEHWGGIENLEIIKKRDNIKNQYAKDNNIDLLRIPYWDYDNIEEILKENILLQHT